MNHPCTASFMWICLWTLSLMVGVPDTQAETAIEQPPNLVIILTDDLGYADVGFNGCQDIPTPNIDRIATEGVRFTNGYVSFAVCGPSRAGLITGRYQDRFGAVLNPTVNPAVPNNGVPLSEKNIAELLKPVGYTTMVVGKWHLGTHPELRPRVRGFDEFYGFLSGGHDYFPERLTTETLEDVEHMWGWYRTKLLHNGRRVGTSKYLTDELSDMAVDFIERKSGEPFFLYLAYNAPHTPMQASEKYLARFGHIDDPKRKTYAAMVSAVDDGVGMVLNALAERGIDDHTMVFFLSDNGGATNNASRNRPLRGFKGAAYEGGIRVPFALRWPGTIPAGVDYDHPVIALDIAGTIVGQSGAITPPDKPLDGVDLTPYLTGQTDGPPHELLFWRFYKDDRLVVRAGDEKLIMAPENREFYDLATDLSESNNVIDERAERASELAAAAESWAESMLPPLSPGLGSWKFDKKE